MSMTTLNAVALPATGEYAPFYAPYLDGLERVQLGSALAEQPEELRLLLADLPEEGGLHRYAPGKWSVRQVVGHLSDAERVFAYRMLRFARGDRTELPGFDENAYADSGGFDRRETAELVEEFARVRGATLALAASLPPEGWSRAGRANGERITVRALAWIVVGHAAHHLRVLRERYGLG
jgi:hypothetical protein